MQLPKSFTTVTPFSKLLALALFLLLPVLGFYLGMEYQRTVSIQQDMSSDIHKKVYVPNLLTSPTIKLINSNKSPTLVVATNSTPTPTDEIREKVILPDGRVSYLKGNNIYIAESNLSNPINVTNISDNYKYYISEYEWSPDFKNLIFSYDHKLWIIIPQANKKDLIMDGSPIGNFRDIQWSEDGIYFYFNNKIMTTVNNYIRNNITGEITEIKHPPDLKNPNPSGYAFLSSIQNWKDSRNIVVNIRLARSQADQVDYGNWLYNVETKQWIKQ